MTDYRYTKKIYNEFAEFYIKKRLDPRQSFFNDYLSNYQMKRHLEGIVKGKKVLDIGCGQGLFTRELQKLGAKAQGIDFSEKLIEYAKEKYKNILFSVANAGRTGYGRSSFDLITANLVVHYFKNLSPLFNEVSRIIKPKGIFIFSIHHPFNEVMTINEYGDETFTMNPYFHNNQYEWEMGEMKLISYHHTFTEISSKLKKSGFYIEELEESRAPRPGFRVDKIFYEFSNKYPTFCIIKAIKK